MQAKLETLCLMEAGRHFTQAATTPFLPLPLIKLFMEAYLLTKAFDQVLEGTFICPAEVDDMTKLLLKVLQQPTKLSQVLPRQIAEITAGWQKAQEATSLSP